MKILNGRILTKDKELLKIEADLVAQEQLFADQNKEISKQKTKQQELKEQNQELMERIRMTEQQLIQVKGNWAESEQEREYLFNQVSEQDDMIQAQQEQIETLQQKLSEYATESTKETIIN